MLVAVTPVIVQEDFKVPVHVKEDDYFSNIDHVEAKNYISLTSQEEESVAYRSIVDLIFDRVGNNKK